MIMVSKKQVSKTSIFELPRVKSCTSKLCTNPLGDPPPPSPGPKTSIFELSGVKNCISRLCTRPLGAPPPRPDTQIGEKHANTA